MRLLHPNPVPKLLSLGLVFVLPLVFYRGLLDSFDLTKATVLWLVAPVLLIWLWINFGSLWGDRALSATVGFLVGAISISTALSIRPGSSIFGQYQRYCGVLTWSAGIIVLLSATLISDRKYVQAFVNLTAFGLALSSGYVFLQAADLDPWTWVFGGQDKPFFGTMGNINTSAGFLGIGICLLLPSLLSSNSFASRVRIGLPVLTASSAVGLNESFQGNAAVLAGVGVGVAVLIFNSRRAFVFPLFFLGIVAISTFTVRSVGQGIAMTSGGVLALFLWSFAELKTLPGYRSSTPNTRLRLTAVVFVVAVFTISSFNLLRDEVADGMRERSAFYGSAVKLWLERPVFGFGLETFGFIFSKNRPAWHAVSYEANRPSSAHSLFIGLLVSGGIILLVAFLLILGLAIRRSSSALFVGKQLDPLRLSVFSMMLGAIVVSAVSVENVALIAIFLFSIGLNLGDWRTRSLRGPLGVKRSFVWIPAFVLLLAVFWSQATRPLRADYFAREALVAVNVLKSDDSAKEKFESAIETAWWDPQQKVRYLSYIQDSGQIAQALDLAVETSYQYMCLPSVALGTMYALAEAGDFSRAIEIAECAQAADPNSLVVVGQIEIVYTAMAEAALSMGKTDIAKSMADLIVEINPSNPLAVSLSAAD